MFCLNRLLHWYGLTGIWAGRTSLKLLRITTGTFWNRLRLGLVISLDVTCSWMHKLFIWMIVSNYFYPLCFYTDCILFYVVDVSKTILVHIFWGLKLLNIVYNARCFKLFDTLELWKRRKFLRNLIFYLLIFLLPLTVCVRKRNFVFEFVFIGSRIHRKERGLKLVPYKLFFNFQRSLFCFPSFILNRLLQN